MTYADEANGWNGGTLLGDQDENSEIYKHYAELCQVMGYRLFDMLQIILRYSGSSISYRILDIQHLSMVLLFTLSINFSP